MDIKIRGFDDKNTSNNIELKKRQSNFNKEEILNKAFQYHSQGNIVEASKYYQLFINQGFKDHRVFLNCGEILKNQGRFKEAEILIRKAIELNPDYALAHNNLGNILKAKNKLKEAELFYCKAIILNSDFTKPYYNLSTLTFSDENGIWQKKLFSKSFLNKKSKDDQLNIYFARANILHKHKNYEESAKSLKLANQLKIEIHPSNSDILIKKSKLLLLESDRADFITEKQINYPQNIFIVGMPRSGSTLVESITSLNNKVIDLGEINILEESFAKWKESKNKVDLINVYQQKINKKTQLNIITNKWLYNYQYSGIIAKCIPNSKIIHCFRNPLDNIHSIYRANFAAGNEYSSSLIDCAKVYLDQEELMSKYKNKFGSKIYNLNYELLVSNPIKEIKSLICWLGWKWENKYLSPHLNPRSIRTASNVQVRSPINSKSVGGWKNYKEMLKPAMEIITQKDKYKYLKY